ncbi:MAG TPA: hypothetical protein VGL40_15160 [Bacillota bacterium]
MADLRTAGIVGGPGTDPLKQVVPMDAAASPAQAAGPISRGDFMGLVTTAAGRFAPDWPADLAAHGVLAGRPVEGLALSRDISRAEAVAFLVKLLRTEPDWETLWLGRPPPGETAPAAGGLPAHWSQEYFLTAAALGLVRGSPEAGFNPDASLSIVEALVLTDRLLHCGETWLPVDADSGALRPITSAAENHVRAFVGAFAREPYDFGELLDTTAGQARELIAQNQDHYKRQYARGWRFKFELLSFRAEVTSRSLYLAKVTTTERMREYVNGKVSESEYGDEMTLRRVGPTWLVCR